MVFARSTFSARVYDIEPGQSMIDLEKLEKKIHESGYFSYFSPDENTVYMNVFLPMKSSMLFVKIGEDDDEYVVYSVYMDTPYVHVHFYDGTLEVSFTDEHEVNHISFRNLDYVFAFGERHVSRLLENPMLFMFEGMSEFLSFMDEDVHHWYVERFAEEYGGSR